MSLEEAWTQGIFSIGVFGKHCVAHADGPTIDADFAVMVPAIKAFALAVLEEAQCDCVPLDGQHHEYCITQSEVNDLKARIEQLGVGEYSAGRRE